ncbi:cache domain-containing sensor histidine kinase [Helcococcus kunzii]|uniref:cache domain-containing sensor histidine kinase n=1 Tax=Helcococcus kunzii TaxID=40091 RepID=UPI0021A97518|nr:histidine kinase [Helcococcus kunzii]MCT1796638.1 histidine kinase [Helcococcus kunzii]MCT1988718.1 histidine kinase [Helcococcus kunzii]
MKISIYFFIISMMIVFFISYTGYKNSVELLIRSKRIQTKQELENAGIYISSYLDKIKSLANLISMNDEIKMISDKQYNDFTSLKNFISIIQKNDNLIENIIIASKTGKIISSSKIDLSQSQQLDKEEWYQKSLQYKNMPYITNEKHKLTSEQEGNLISITSEIKDASNNHQGIIIIDLSHKFIEDYITKMNFGDNGYGFIATSQEKLLFDTNTLSENKKYIELLKSRMKSLEGDFIGETFNIPSTDWIAVGVTSMEGINSLKNVLITNTIFWAIIVLIISIFISLLISNRITKPIRNLIKNIKNTDHKLTPLPYDKNSSSEIQDLTTAFNQLLSKVSDLTLSIAEKEEAKRIFELKALQSQINPHFIYNTLDTIMWLIEFNENEKAIEVTKSLGKILRLTLGINQDFVRLEEEVAHVKNYLEIQKIRYDDKFEYKFDISKDTEQLKIPKLILQPIVENAIYHGIKPLKGKGEITIKSYLEDETLFIIVEDNGIGPQQAKDKNIKTKLSGIGMSNVDQRIKILNNDNCGIKLSRENGVTRVVYGLEINECKVWRKS